MLPWVGGVEVEFTVDGEGVGEGGVVGEVVVVVVAVVGDVVVGVISLVLRLSGREIVLWKRFANDT